MEIQREKSYTERFVRKDDTIFRDYIENTSANGVAKVFAKQYGVPRRLFWLVIILGATAACLYTIVCSIIFLASAPTSTSVAITSVRPLEFPGVTVCNLNFFTASSLDAVGLLGAGILGVNQNSFDRPKNGCISEISEFPMAKDVVLEDLWSVKGPQSLSEFIPLCTYLGKPCDMEHDFTLSTLSFGACYTFNGYSKMPPSKTYGTGSSQGLQLLLNINQSEYTASAFLDAGAKVYIHVSSEPAPIRDNGMAVPPGRVAFIGLRKETVANEAGVGCNAEYDNSRFNFLGNNFSYSSAACLVDCQLTAIAEHCGCYYAANSFPPSNSSYANVRNCTFSDVCCIQAVLSSVNCTCPTSCVTDFYYPSTSYSSMPAEYVEYFDYDTSYLEKNYVEVLVYFETNIVKTETTTFSYGFVALLSDIGGQLGLFIGISVITIFEFCMWLLDECLDRLCCFRISWKKKRGKEGDQIEDVENGLRTSMVLN